MAFVSKTTECRPTVEVLNSVCVSRGRPKTTRWTRLKDRWMPTNYWGSQQCLWFHEVDQRQPEGIVSKTTECRQTSGILNSFCEVSRTFLRCKSLSASDDSHLQAAICKPPTAIRLIELRCGISCAKRRYTRNAFTNKSTRMGREEDRSYLWVNQHPIGGLSWQSHFIEK